MTTDTPTNPAPTLDPVAAADRLHEVTAVATDALDHMQTALTAAEAELTIARYHHVQRLAHQRLSS